MSATTEQRVISIILTAAGLPSESQVTADTELLQSGLSLDSSNMLMILLSIEKEFGLEMDARELFAARALNTVGTLVSFVNSRCAARSQAVAAAQEHALSEM